MNLDGLTEEQRLSVERIEGPLLISAGAGSGKTYTLTQRIAYALTERSSGIDDIEQILAITFTEKAAGEIKARVKSSLQQEALFDQVAKVDGAWISTIHAMCSRILRSHALDLGIDPGFSVIDDTTRNDLIMEAIDEVLGFTNAIIAQESYEKLFNEYPARSAFQNENSIASMLETLLAKAAGLRNGLEGIHLGPEALLASRLAREIVLMLDNLMPLLEVAGTSASAEKARLSCTEALCFMEDYLIKNEDDEGYQELARVLGDLYIPGNFGNGEVKAAVKEYQQEYYRICDELILGIARPLLDELLSLAEDVERAYGAKKEALSVFDNDDLLVQTLLAFENYPEIADYYARQFKLVMVDEFQDTNQLQIDIISYLVGSHSASLCTVGDSQQSIYRFRGADVKVYEAHKQTMRSSEVGALSVELTKNFRSHRDILSFVDRVFEQEGVFGESFMSLSPDENRISQYHSSDSRVDIILATLPAGTQTGLSTLDAKRTEAKAIAKRFSTLREAGHSEGDMVVLLGKMSHADIYAESLRDAGFESIITGGSLFDKSPEVNVLVRLAQVLANCYDSAALFEVLSSDMFSLSTDSFLELASYEDRETQELKRCDIARGFACLVDGADEDRLSEDPLLCHAVEVMSQAWKQCTTKPLSQVMTEIFLNSGWAMRLQKQGARGMAKAANIYKGLRMIEELERTTSYGLSQLSYEYSKQISLGLKEAPGALNGEGDSVVKIMTIHASKGLEFPIVALADFYGIRSVQDKLLVENQGGNSFASLSLGESLNAFPALKKRLNKYQPYHDVSDEEREDCLKNSSSLAQYRAALKASSYREELAEARRKFYVGLTRASEALVISMQVKASNKDPFAGYKDVIEDLRAALCGEEDFPDGIAKLSYGGLYDANFERIAVEPSEESYLRAETRTCFVPEETCEEKAALYSYRSQREGVFSYSSLEIAKEKNTVSYSDERGETELGAKPGYPTPDSDKATNLGTAFHRLAQAATESATLPSENEIKAQLRFNRLSDEQGERLRRAVNAWFASSYFEEVQSYAHLRTELPFFLSIEDLYLEGEIDLLCSNTPDKPILIIDYKTGGSESEGSEVLIEKHRLQAECYAYAVLRQGYPEVTLRFVRVEQLNALKGLDAVSYCYTSEDLPRLKAEIVSAYRRAQLSS